MNTKLDVTLNYSEPPEPVPFYIYVQGLLQCQYPTDVIINDLEYIKYNLKEIPFYHNNYIWTFIHLKDLVNDIIKRREITNEMYFLFSYIVSNFAEIISSAELLNVIKLLPVDNDLEDLLDQNIINLLTSFSGTIDIYFGLYKPNANIIDNANNDANRNDKDDDKDDEEEEEEVEGIPRLFNVNITYSQDNILDINEKSSLILTDPDIHIETYEQLLTNPIANTNKNISIKEYKLTWHSAQIENYKVVGTFKSNRKYSDVSFIFNFKDLQSELLKYDKESKVNLLSDSNQLEITCSNITYLRISLIYNLILNIDYQDPWLAI